MSWRPSGVLLLSTIVRIDGDVLLLIHDLLLRLLGLLLIVWGDLVLGLDASRLLRLSAHHVCWASGVSTKVVRVLLVRYLGLALIGAIVGVVLLGLLKHLLLRLSLWVLLICAHLLHLLLACELVRR